MQNIKVSVQQGSVSKNRMAYDMAKEIDSFELEGFTTQDFDVDSKGVKDAIRRQIKTGIIRSITRAISAPYDVVVYLAPDPVGRLKKKPVRRAGVHGGTIGRR